MIRTTMNLLYNTNLWISLGRRETIIKTLSRDLPMEVIGEAKISAGSCMCTATTNGDLDKLKYALSLKEGREQ